MTNKFDLSEKTIWVPGANGMVGSAMGRALEHQSFKALSTTRDEVDLLDANQISVFYRQATSFLACFMNTTKFMCTALS